MNRGDIVTVSGGVYARKPRPALIIQDDHFPTSESVTVIPFTTTPQAPSPIRVPVAVDSDSSLYQSSFAMVDKITTVRRHNLGETIGRVDQTTMTACERGLLVFLGFGS